MISYMLQGGVCRHCGERISIRYPLIELATSGLFALAAWKFGATLEGAVYAGFFWVLVVLTVIDLEHRLLLNKIVYPAFVAGWVFLTIAALAEGDVSRLIDAAVGAVAFGGFLFVVAFVYPAGMGGGDVKLGFVLGTFLGYLGGVGLTVVGMFLAFLIGAIGGVAAMSVTGGGRKTQIPFGPFLALGAVIATFAGQPLLDVYLGAV